MLDNVGDLVAFYDNLNGVFDDDTDLSQVLNILLDYTSDQRIVIFPANRNRNRFAEPTSVRIGIGIVREFQNLRIGIGIIFVRWEVFANNSRIPDI